MHLWNLNDPVTWTSSDWKPWMKSSGKKMPTMNHQPTPDTTCAVLSLYSMWIFGTSLITWHNKMQSLQIQTLHRFLQNLQQNTTVSVTHNKDMLLPGLCTFHLPNKKCLTNWSPDLFQLPRGLPVWAHGAKLLALGPARRKKWNFCWNAPEGYMFNRLNRRLKVQIPKSHLVGCILACRATTTWFFCLQILWDHSALILFFWNNKGWDSLAAQQRRKSPRRPVPFLILRKNCL